jgi:putative transposase
LQVWLAGLACRSGLQVWLADLTYIPTGEGWLYPLDVRQLLAFAERLAAILDMYTRKIVGWSMAVERQRPQSRLVHHSDRGIQYAAEAYRSALAHSRMTPSMSRKGDCWDNAPMESFFHTLKVERVNHRTYATRNDARRDLFAYIEGFYNSHRLHSALDYLSPVEIARDVKAAIRLLSRQASCDPRRFTERAKAPKPAYHFLPAGM